MEHNDDAVLRNEPSDSESSHYDEDSMSERSYDTTSDDLFSESGESRQSYRSDISGDSEDENYEPWGRPFRRVRHVRGVHRYNVNHTPEGSSTTSDPDQTQEGADEGGPPVGPEEQAVGAGEGEPVGEPEKTPGVHGVPQEGEPQAGAGQAPLQNEVPRDFGRYEQDPAYAIRQIAGLPTCPPSRFEVSIIYYFIRLLKPQIGISWLPSTKASTTPTIVSSNSESVRPTARSICVNVPRDSSKPVVMVDSTSTSFCDSQGTSELEMSFKPSTAAKPVQLLSNGQVVGSM